MSGARSDIGLARLVTMMDMDIMNDDIGDVLERNAPTPSYVHVSAATVEGFIAVENELLREVDEHVGGKDDPEGLRLDDGVAEGAGAGCYGVVVGGVGDDVEAASLPAERVLAESDGTIGEALAVELPVWIATPAVVDRVSGQACA